MMVCALGGTARFAIDHVDQSPRPALVVEPIDIAAVEGLPKPSGIDSSYTVARMPLSAVALWPVARATTDSGFISALRLIALAAFALAGIFVALTIRALGGGWIAAGFAALVLAAASKLRDALMLSSFEAVSLVLTALLAWLTARAIHGRGSQRLLVSAAMLLVLSQPLAAGVAAIALWIAARARNWARLVPALPLVLASVLFVGFTAAGYDPMGRGGSPPNAGVRSIDAVGASLQGELREAVEGAWDVRALGAVVFVVLLGIGLAALRPGREPMSRRGGASVLVTALSYLAVFVPAYVLVVVAAGGDVPASLFFSVTIGFAVVAGLSLEGFHDRSGLDALVAISAAGVLLIPLFSLRGLG